MVAFSKKPGCRQKLAAVVNFCTNDYAFLRPCILSLLAFCREIVVPVCDHFFDGQPENQVLLNRAVRENPEVQFLFFPFRQSFLEMAWDGPTEARLLGWKALRERPDYVYFVDCDEIIDPYAMLRWLDHSGFQGATCIKLSNYWYFRETRYQWEKWEDSMVVARHSFITPQLLKTDKERDQLIYKAKGKMLRDVTGLDGQPMIHHYSWVRTKEQMLKKAANWSHRGDRNWAALIEEEFSQPFRGHDMIFRRNYREVVPAVDIKLDPFRG